MNVLAEVTKKIKETFPLRYDADLSFYKFRGRTAPAEPSLGDALEGRKVYQKDRGLLARATEGGEAIFFENIQTDERYAELSHSQANKQAGSQGLALISPIRVAGISPRLRRIQWTPGAQAHLLMNLRLLYLRATRLASQSTISIFLRKLKKRRLSSREPISRF